MDGKRNAGKSNDRQKMLRRPVRVDGWRTPTIEDVERYLLQLDNRLGTRSRGFNGPYSGTASSLQLAPPSCERLAEIVDEKVSIRKRIAHFTWANFTCTMATGGLANLLASAEVPWRFYGLDTIGTIIFISTIILFLATVALICCRFIMHPYTLRLSFVHPTEGLFVGASVVGFGAIVIGCANYGIDKTGYWFQTAMYIVFWVYCTLALLSSCAVYLILWSTSTHTIARMTPIWIFPVYPLLLCGVIAGTLSASLTPSRSRDMIVGGLTFQAVGFLVSLAIYSAFIYRLMTQKLPIEPNRPGMFVSVGPAAFTVQALVSAGKHASRSFPQDFMGDGPTAAFVFKVLCYWTGLSLWGLASWFCLVSIGAHHKAIKREKHLTFGLTWFSFVFPNTVLAGATFAIGDAFSCKPIQIIGTAMTIALVFLWLYVFGMWVRAIYRGDIMWPGKDEDRDEGGFTREKLLRSIQPEE